MCSLASSFGMSTTVRPSAVTVMVSLTVFRAGIFVSTHLNCNAPIPHGAERHFCYGGGQDGEKLKMEFSHGLQFYQPGRNEGGFHRSETCAAAISLGGMVR